MTKAESTQLELLIKCAHLSDNLALWAIKGNQSDKQLLGNASDLLQEISQLLTQEMVRVKYL